MAESGDFEVKSDCRTRRTGWSQRGSSLSCHLDQILDHPLGCLLSRSWVQGRGGEVPGCRVSPGPSVRLSVCAAKVREENARSLCEVTCPPSSTGSSLGPSVQMSSGMSQLIGLKEKGLPQIARLLQSGNSDVVRSGASLLSNMSRHPALHRAMGEHPTAQSTPDGPRQTPTFQRLLEGHPLTLTGVGVQEGSLEVGRGRSPGVDSRCVRSHQPRDPSGSWNGALRGCLARTLSPSLPRLLTTCPRSSQGTKCSRR